MFVYTAALVSGRLEFSTDADFTAQDIEALNFLRFSIGTRVVPLQPGRSACSSLPVPPAS
jgi:hypothetical protein